MFYGDLFYGRLCCILDAEILLTLYAFFFCFNGLLNMGGSYNAASENMHFKLSY